MSTAGVNLWALHKLSSCCCLWLALFTLLSPCQVSVYGATLSAFGSGRHDGVQRVEAVCPDSPGRGATSTGKGQRPSVVYFTGQQEGGAASYTWTSEQVILEETAQALESRGVRVAVINLDSCQQFAHLQDVAPGAIHVYLNRKYVYQGLHSSDALVSFILKVNSAAVHSIDSKAHKKAFDKVEGPRLVGLLKRDSKEYEEFARAAEALHPYVSCHIVSDAKVLLEEGFPEPVGALKHLKDKNPGTILYYEPYGENPTPLPGKNTAREILQYFNQHQLSFLRRLYPYDIYATMHIYESSNRLVLAFLLPKTPEGLTLYKSLKRLANTENVGDYKTKVLYINMEDFPMNIGALERQFKVDLAKPVMGLVNITTGEAKWFTNPDLHLLPKEDQVKEVTDWFTRVARDNIRVDGLAPVEFKQEVKEEEVVKSEVEDGDFKRTSEDKDEDEKEPENEDKDDAEEKDDASPTGKDKEEEKPKAAAGHRKADRSAYLKQFDEGSKLFTGIYTLITDPIKTLLGVPPAETAGTHHAEDEEDGDHTDPVATKSHPTKNQPPKAKEPKVKKSHESKPKKHVKETNAKAKSLKAGKVNKVKQEAEKAHHKTGKLNTPYMRQFAATESDKIFSNIFKFIARPVVWVLTPSERVETPEAKTPFGEQKVVQSVHRLDSPYLRQFAASENDKIFSNIFKLVGRIISLPYTFVFGSGSSGEPAIPFKPKEVRCEMFKATEQDKIFKNIFLFVYRPISVIVNTVRNQPLLEDSGSEEDSSEQEPEAAVSEDADQEEPEEEKKAVVKEKPKEKPPIKAAAAKKQHKDSQKINKEALKKAKQAKKDVKKAQAQTAKAMKKQQVKAKVDKKSAGKKAAKSEDKAPEGLKSIISYVKNLVSGDGTKKGEKKAPEAPVKKGTSHAKTPATKQEAPAAPKEPVKEEKKEVKHEKEEKVEQDDDDDDDDDNGKKDDDDDDDDDKEKEETPAKPEGTHVPAHSSKMDSKYLKQFRAEESDKLISHVFKSTIGQLIGAGPSSKAAPEPEPEEETPQKEAEETKADSDDKKPEKDTQHVTNLGSKDSKYLKQFSAEPQDKIISYVFKSTIGQIVNVGSGSDEQKEEESNEEGDEEDTEDAEYEVGDFVHSKDSDYMNQFRAEAHDKIFSHLFHCTIGQLFQGASATETEGKQPVKAAEKAKEAGKKKHVRKFKKPVPVPDFKSKQAKGHHKKIDAKMWTGTSEDKIFASIFRFVFGGFTKVFTGGHSQPKVEANEDGDALEDRPEDPQSVTAEEAVEEAEDKADMLNSLFSDKVYGSEESQTNGDEDGTDQDFLVEAFKDQDDDDKDVIGDGEDEDEKETIEIDDGEEIEVEEGHDKVDEGDEEEGIEEDKAEETSDEFVEAVSEEEAGEDDQNEEDDGTETQETEKGGLDEKEEERTMDEEVDEMSQAEFIQDAFQDPEDEEEDEKPEEHEEEKVEEEEKGGEEEKTEQEEDDDKLSQTDFLDGVFSQEEEDDDEEKPEEHVGEVEEEESQSEENVQQPEEDDTLSQNDFLDGVFSDEPASEDEDKTIEQTDEEEEPQQEEQKEVEEEEHEEEVAEEDEEEEVSKKVEEKFDSMTTEDFISMAFTEEEGEQDDMFKDDEDEFNDPEFLEKHVSYRPFSEDPRKQFQYTDDDDDDDDDDVHLFDHGEAYDRHRHGRQHL